jgi:hypothetical protein
MDVTLGRHRESAQHTALTEPPVPVHSHAHHV